MSNFSSHYKSLCYLGIPIVVGQLGTIVLGFADTLMIGWHSTEELAAASFVTNLFTLVLLFALGFSYSLTPIVGNLFGQGQPERIGGMVKNSLLANAVVAILLMVVMGIVYGSIEHLGQPLELIPLMKPYFIVNLISIPFVVCFNTFKQFYDGITRTQTSMYIMIAGNIMNIIGNYMLIYGKMGLPEMGLLGAGLSTLFSRIFMAVAITVIFVLSPREAAYRKGFKTQKLNKDDYCRLNRLGLPLALQLGMETAAFSLSSVMVGWIDTTSLAAHQVVLTISQLFYMVYYGMASAVSIRVSYFHGQKDWTALHATTVAGFRLILAMAGIVSIPILFARTSIGNLFTDSPEVTNLVATAIIPLIIYQFGDGMQCTYANALRGISHVKPLAIIAFISYFLISLPLGYLLGIRLHYGLVGIWSAFPFGLTTAGILYYLSFQKKFRQERFQDFAEEKGPSTEIC